MQKHSKNKHEKLPSPKKTHAIEGIIRIRMPLSGFVTNPSTKTDIEVPGDFLATALHGDLVTVAITSITTEGKTLGEVLSIIARKKEAFTGELTRAGSMFHLIPDDGKMYRNILIPKEKLHGAKEKEKVLVKITRWQSMKEAPLGEVVERLGKPGAHETEMAAILYDRGFIPKFPQAIEKEAEKVRMFLKDPSITSRRDFREVTTITIDPKTAKDFDDALSVKELPNNEIEIGVHIADVSFFVRPGTTLDREAARRATSIYMVDRTIPMLPETLSNELCSLNPNEEKLTYSAVFVLDREARIKREWFGRTRIKSDKRFTYEEAQETLNKKSGPFYKELSILYALGTKLAEAKFKAGAIRFEDNEVEFKLDAAKRPISIKVKERLTTHRLVEDWMLLANRRVAEYIHKLSKGKEAEHAFIYRVHNLPDEIKIGRVLSILRRLGYNIKIESPITQRDINKILDTVAGTTEEALIHTATIQSMSKAIYTTKNIGHFGLAFAHYTHFTSPIRRYPDVMVHRLLESYLSGKTPGEKELDRYGELAIYSSQMERVAEEAERESKKFKQVEFMKGKIGTVSTGIISGVTKFGFFVQEEKTRAEGLVALRTLTDDYYIYDEAHLALVGKTKKRRFRLGDKVKIAVTGADIKRRQINYIIAE